jgi:hypothetical protein
MNIVAFHYQRGIVSSLWRVLSIFWWTIFCLKVFCGNTLFICLLMGWFNFKWSFGMLNIEIKQKIKLFWTKKRYLIWKLLLVMFVWNPIYKFITSVCLWRRFWGVGKGEAGEATGDLWRPVSVCDRMWFSCYDATPVLWSSKVIFQDVFCMCFRGAIWSLLRTTMVS